MFFRIAFLALATVVHLGASAQSQVDGQGTWERSLLGRTVTGQPVAATAPDAVFLYDSILNISWLRDANYARTVGVGNGGLMTWNEAQAWVSTLAIGGYTGWRMPIVIDTWTAPSTGPDGCNRAVQGTDCGWNVQTKSGIPDRFESGQIVYSEFAHLSQVTLGNPDPVDSLGGVRTRGPFNSGPFINPLFDYYWTGTEFVRNGPYPSPVVNDAWFYGMGYGFQSTMDKGFVGYVHPVLDGDVTPVPEPATWVLALVGLVLLAASRRAHCARAIAV